VSGTKKRTRQRAGYLLSFGGDGGEEYEEEEDGDDEKDACADAGMVTRPLPVGKRSTVGPPVVRTVRPTTGSPMKKVVHPSCSAGLLPSSRTTVWRRGGRFSEKECPPLPLTPRGGRTASTM
jgi:hypothetical protein